MTTDRMTGHHLMTDEERDAIYEQILDLTKLDSPRGGLLGFGDFLSNFLPGLA